VENLGTVRYIARLLGTDADADTVVDVTDRLFAEQLGADGVAVVMGNSVFAVKVGPTAQKAGLQAGDLVRSAAEVMGGRGGGRADFAQGAVKEPAQRESALALIRDMVSRAGDAGA
jgi:alanyl-tRNA synthetase